MDSQHYHDTLYDDRGPTSSNLTLQLSHHSHYSNSSPLITKKPSSLFKELPSPEINNSNYTIPNQGREPQHSPNERKLYLSSNNFYANHLDKESNRYLLPNSPLRTTSSTSSAPSVSFGNLRSSTPTVRSKTVNYTPFQKQKLELEQKIKQMEEELLLASNEQQTPSQTQSQASRGISPDRRSPFLRSSSSLESSVALNFGAKRLRQYKQDVAIRIENRIARLQALEQEYMKKKDMLRKQNEILSKVHERHVMDLTRKEQLERQRYDKMKRDQQVIQSVKNTLKNGVEQSMSNLLEYKKHLVNEVKEQQRTLKEKKEKQNMLEMKSKKKKIEDIEKGKENARMKKESMIYTRLDKTKEDLTQEAVLETEMANQIDQRVKYLLEYEKMLLDKLTVLEEQTELDMSHEML